MRVVAHFSAEFRHNYFSETYKSRGKHCGKLQTMFNVVLAQAEKQLHTTFGSAWEVSLSQTNLVCHEAGGSDHSKARIADLRGVDQQFLAKVDRSAVDDEADIPLVDWAKMSAAFGSRCVSQMQEHQ